jgi:uncharacterized protein YkwD
MRRIRGIAPLAAVVAVAALAACAPLKSGPGGAPLPYRNAHPNAHELYFMVNSERSAHGLASVGWSDQLGGLAQRWSEHMAATGTFAHQDLGAILQHPAYAGWSALAENVSHAGCGTTAVQIHQAWMSSPTHRANILGNHEVGIGVACNGGDLYATEDFGR